MNGQMRDRTEPSPGKTTINEVPRMDFLNRAVGQLTDLFKSMTPGARLTAGLLLAMIVVSMAFLVNRVGSDQDAYLMGGEVFSSPQLHNMEAAFAKANLNDYRIEGNRIHVSCGQAVGLHGCAGRRWSIAADFRQISGESRRDQ